MDTCHVSCCMHVGMRLETEGHDRSDINLPGNQLQLLQDATDSATSESSKSKTCLTVKKLKVYFIELTLLYALYSAIVKLPYYY